MHPQLNDKLRKIPVFDKTPILFPVIASFTSSFQESLWSPQNSQKLALYATKLFLAWFNCCRQKLQNNSLEARLEVLERKVTCSPVASLVPLQPKTADNYILASLISEHEKGHQ